MLTRLPQAALRRSVLSFALGVGLAAFGGESRNTIADQPGPLLRSMLQGPLVAAPEIVFAARVSGNDHWYVNFGYYCNAPERMGYRDGGRLCRLNLATGEMRVLLEDREGGIRDPQVHYDGRKILFSYRPAGSSAFHLYEINVDGSELTQLTDGPDDDIEPTYLPDGGIMFCSSRCQRVVNCWLSRVATLYRCDADGRNTRLISSNNDHDNTPWVLPDGRILYMRWEYVDRSQVHFHHLWTLNPDGTGQMVYYGNELGGLAMLDAKPIPNTEQIVASFSPGHGLPEHMGYVTIVDPRGGPDVQTTARRLNDRLFRDPYAVTMNCFLVADQAGIHVMDGQGNVELVYELPPDNLSLQCHEPRLLASRPRERPIASQVDLSQQTGELVLANIYEGRAMEGIQPGDIKRLLVLEQLPKPVNFSGGQDPLSIGGTFTLARILGTVPVEADGSAYMQVPALRSVFMVALDENANSVKRMQSFVTVQPGERTGCVGCHEQRSHAPRIQPGLMALNRAASIIEPIRDVPDVVDFARDIQPILTEHCVGCHNSERPAGNADLSGDHTPVFTIAYWTITKLGLVADGRNRPYSQQAPRSIGSSGSRLMKLIDGGHYGATLTERQCRTVRLWIETGAPYPGTYAALGSGMYPVKFPIATMKRRCGACHDVGPIADPHPHYVQFNGQFGPRGEGMPAYLADAPWQQPLVPQSRCNLDRPEKSIMLRAPLVATAGGLELCTGPPFANVSDPDYQELLAAIRLAAEQLQLHKRFDMPGFRPNQHYTREMQRFGILPSSLPADAPIDVYSTDQAYWKSFWHGSQ